MKSSRREFLASLTALPSASFFDSLRPPEINPPLSSLSPIETKHHSVTYDYDENEYIISVSWLPYKLPNEGELILKFPRNKLTSSFNQTLRNPFDMYIDSRESDITEKLTMAIQETIASLAFTNHSSNMSPKPPNYDSQNMDNRDKSDSVQSPPFFVSYNQTKQNKSNETVLTPKPSIIDSRRSKEQSKQSSKSSTSKPSRGLQKGQAGENSLQRNGQPIKSDGSWEEFFIPQLVRFVQRIEYTQDYERNIPIDYPQYPIETLYFGVGDCEDTAILLATVLENLTVIDDVRTGLVVLPGHMATLAAIPDLPKSEYYEEFTVIDGVSYTYFETTSPTTIYKTPQSRKEEPLFIYHNGEMKNINIHMLPASVREGSRIGKEGVMNLLGNYIG